MRRPRPSSADRSVQRVVREEEQILESVQEAIRSSGQVAATLNYDDELLTLRDAMAEEKLPDDQAMLLEQMDRIAALSSVRGGYLPGRVDPESPYFAHLGIETDAGERRDILLGKRTFTRGGVKIVDWRDAPISRVFYGYREGDAFAEEIAGGELTGEVKSRRTVTILGGSLLRIHCPQGILLKTSEGWKNLAAGSSSLEGGAGSANRPDTLLPLLGSFGGDRDHRPDKHLPEIAALLDSEQFALLTSDPNSLIVVAGSAGSGKTTVGLHRIAYLNFTDPERFRARRMQVLVFGPALGRYISRVLPALGVEGVPVRTLREWATHQMRGHFPGLPRLFSASPPASVVRFKTHRALIPMLDEAVLASPHADPAELFDELFTDRGWMRSGIELYAPGAFSEGEIGEIHSWCREAQFRRVDGADDEDPATFDEEDAMILLRLHQLLRGPLRWHGKRKLAYDHLMIDEAQDFSPLELLVLLQPVRSGSVTLAGDPAQKITDNDFSSWSEVLEAVGQEHFAISPLRVSYRSTREITALAQAILGPLAPDDPPRAVRSGSPVEWLRFGGQGEALTFLGDALADLARREPSASVAVLTRTTRQAEESFQALRRTGLSTLRLVSEQDFSFGPGIEVTDASQTKGLEFDYVVLLHVDRENYPATDAARHLLHVACTRAIHQLWLVCWEAPSSLLPPWLKPRLEG